MIGFMRTNIASSWFLLGAEMQRRLPTGKFLTNRDDLSFLVVVTSDSVKYGPFLSRPVGIGTGPDILEEDTSVDVWRTDGRLRPKG